MEIVVICVKNWSKYQSYKDRRPPWIRFHRTILDDFTFQSMTAEARAFLPMLWLLACEHEDPVSGLIPYSYEEIEFRLRMRKGSVTSLIQELQAADFIECIESVTNPLQNRIETVPPETETETETETEAEGISDAGASPRRPAIPYEEIVNLYHELLPKNPRIHSLTTKRKAQIRARWLDGSLPDLDTWAQYFKFVSESNFLTGMVMPRDGRKPFVANLEWLTNETNFTNVAEKKYHG